MRSPAFPPRRPSALIRYIVPAVFIIVCLYWMSGSTRLSSTYTPTADSQLQFEKPGHQNTLPAGESGQGAVTVIYSEAEKPAGGQQQGHQAGGDTPSQTGAGHVSSAAQKPAVSKPHPIDDLLSAAEKEYSDLMATESHSLAEAAAAYRKRRGRHPPPGFDQWYAFANEHKAVIVEDFWDRIYQDLEPFWALPAPHIRKEAWDFEMTINIRSGNATARSDWFWTQIWLEMIKTIEHLLPDMDLALNAMDEPRLVVPWEDIDAYVEKAHKTKVLIDPKDVVNEYQKLPSPGEGTDRSEPTTDKAWEKSKPYWHVARRGCAPDSAARKVEVMTDFDHSPHISTELAESHMYKGYVSNFSMSTEFCHQPDLQGLNGIFIDPLSVSATKVLFPIFGGSKLAVNNEILLPAPMYWNEEERFTGGNDHGPDWMQKKDQVVWRGVATGGANRENNWRAFQRHRFVAMNNGTKISRAENRVEAPLNFALPDESTYDLAAQEQGKLGDWVDGWANVSFVDLFCHPKEEDGRCNYTGSYFEVTKGMKMQEQFAYKYLPDIDGNSFSGRYLGFLRSTSLPVKATLWHEWHDSRLVAWKHFVPMDNRYVDYYGIMEYFLGYNGGGDASKATVAHDEVAQRIATDGKDWAERVLRKEDMQIYVLRLLLEYARISDERRETMGWVDDLLDGNDIAAR
ncbi:Capsule associated protein [Pleurostoma richardsiae]|uniref:Capsule associated protein n=1 Tax=Pleurostoma richardsiae TaxID=41990 RepID=A0AA38VEZ4_9PEZI|nr:Capsule associated protein [Pleurostoma richardsiae]